MSQQQRSHENAPRLATFLPPSNQPDVAPAPPVRLIAGADVEDMDLAGRTVGDARIVAQAIFGIDPAAVALLDGSTVEDAQTIAAGQLLEFVKYAGVKGAPTAARGSAARSGSIPPVIELAGESATWVRSGRAHGRTTLHALLERVAAAGPPPAAWQLYPRHVRLMVPRRGGSVVGVVIEMPPGPRQVRWIADQSPAPCGPSGLYETRYLSFPWLVLVVVFARNELSGAQQAFFRPHPIESLNDTLYVTNLLNVAHGYDQKSWVCLANLVDRLAPLTWEQRIAAVTRHFWRAAFNRSSEVHEGNSHWSGAAAIDSRFASAATWEAATRVHPYFALEVNWSSAPEPLGRTLHRMLDMVAPWRPIARVEQLVTLMQQEAT